MQTKETKKKILVMDDEDMVGEIACQMLTYFGFEGVWVKNGAEAIQEYETQKETGQAYAAIILDLTIPGGMGGKETIVEILALDPAVKAFVSSGYANDPIMVNYKDYGFAGAIAKPFDIAAVQQILNMVL